MTVLNRSACAMEQTHKSEIEVARQLVQLSSGGEEDEGEGSATAQSKSGVDRRKENDAVADETLTARVARETEEEEESRQPRKRRRFRSLAEIYKVTEAMTAVAGERVEC